jgi:hypothetical protein
MEIYLPQATSNCISGSFMPVSYRLDGVKELRVVEVRT